MNDLISRQVAIDVINEWLYDGEDKRSADQVLNDLPSIGLEQQSRGYEYHYDHTDCIWYRVGGKEKCPVTCSQYRDGWNDAMNYIFKNGEGYKPYRRNG